MSDRLPAMLVSVTTRRFWCAFFVLWLFIPTIIASDFGLINPAAQEFSKGRTETRNTENFTRKTPAFNDRTLPTAPKTETIRQVSVFDEATDDPFPMPPQMLAAQPFPFDWNASPPVDPNAFTGYANPHFTAQPHIAMQDMQNMYLAQQQFAQQQFAQQQFAQPQFSQQLALYPQQYQPEYMMPYMNPNMNPHVGMHPQYSYVDPYGIQPYQMGYPMEYQNVPDYQSLYQAFLIQQMTRPQAEETQAKANSEKETAEAKQQADTNWTLNNLVPVRVSSPLGETLLVCAKTVSPFITPPGPDKGVGMPLVNISWLDHPYYFSGFVGYMSGSELVSNMIDQKNGGSGGLIFGYNFNDYWGLESRLHFASIDIHDTDYAKRLFEESYRLQFPDASMVPMLTTRTNQLTILDAAVHYYPLGNAKWRPYFKYGFGVGRQRFVNTFGFENKSDIITMPLGVGVRYWWNERLAIQADLIDNVIFASDATKTQHNFAFTLGLTYAFGSNRTKHPVHYWPATPSMGSKW